VRTYLHYLTDVAAILIGRTKENVCVSVDSPSNTTDCEMFPPQMLLSTHKHSDEQQNLYLKNTTVSYSITIKLDKNCLSSLTSKQALHLRSLNSLHEML
jgi:hypothetical protein